MKQLVTQLTHLLEEELLLYSTLEDIIRREQQLIEGLNSVEMMKLVSQKKTIGTKIEEVEQRRGKLVEQLAQAIGCTKDRFNIPLLLEHLNGEQRGRLHEIRTQLKQSILNVREESQKLEIRATGLIGLYNDTLDFIMKELTGKQETTQYPNAYQSKAGRTSAQSVIVSRQA